MVTNNDKFDLSIIKVALEHANFGDDFIIRDALNDFVRGLQLDLDEVGFEPSEHLKLSGEALENALNDSETPRIRKEPELRIINDEELKDVREVEVRSDDDLDEVFGTKIVNVDDELNDYDEP